MPDFDTWSWDRSCFSTRINQAIRAGPFSKLRSKFSLFSSLIYKLDHFLELQNQRKLNYSSAKLCHNSQTTSKSWQPCLWFFSSCWYCFCAASDPGLVSLFRSAVCSLRKDFPWCGTWVEREIQPWWCGCRGECWGSDGGHNRLVQQEPEMNPEAAALIAICCSYSSLQIFLVSFCCPGPASSVDLVSCAVFWLYIVYFSTGWFSWMPESVIELAR